MIWMWSRLQRFYRGIKALKEEEEILAIRGERRREIRYAIYCFKEQEEFIANIFPEAEIKTINIKDVCKLFSIGTEDFWMLKISKKSYCIEWKRF